MVFEERFCNMITFIIFWMFKTAKFIFEQSQKIEFVLFQGYWPSHTAFPSYIFLKSRKKSFRVSFRYVTKSKLFSLGKENFFLCGTTITNATGDKRLWSTYCVLDSVNRSADGPLLKKVSIEIAGMQFLSSE